MQNFTFLLPLYNDWESFIMIANKINEQLKILNKKGQILLVNDNSTSRKPELPILSNIKFVNILDLNKNLGSQKAISIGLQYLKKQQDEMIITILDSDGEDDVSKIPIMIETAEKNKDKVIVSSRTKRQENIFFKILYFTHKLLTFLFTLNWISYGNYSSFHSNQLKKILSNKNSWLAFSACVANNCDIIKMQAERKKRLIGVSKLSFLGLIYHSLRVNSVFILRGFMLSIFYICFLLIFLKFGYDFFIYIIILIVLYNILLLSTLVLNLQKNFLNFEDFIINK